MENLKERPTTEPLGIHYYFGPCRYKQGHEVRFPRLVPPKEEPAKPPRPARYRPSWMPNNETLAIILALGWFAILIPLSKTTQYFRELDLLRPPPPELVPAHPTVGMVITDHHHIWVYLPTGWLDP